MDFLDRIKAAIPDSISLRDIPAPLRPLAVVAAPLINQTGLTTITANPPAHKPALSRPSVAVKPIPKVPEPSIGGFIKETILPVIGRNVALPIALATAPAQPVLAEVRDFVQDRAAGKPLSINIASIGNPIMMAADAVGIGKPLRHGTADLVNGTVETILEGVDWAIDTRNDIRNWAAPHIGRSLDQFGIDPSVRNAVVAIVEAPLSARRDQGMAGPTAQWLEERRRDMARLTGDGDYAIYNGAGWSSQGQEGGLTSIFVRQADGNSVMLRPGQAEYWQHMLPYAAPTILSMFYGGGETKGAAGAFKAASTMEMAGGVAVIGGEFNQVITLKPEAYRTLSDLVRDPSLLNDPHKLASVMNDVFGEYGRKEGSMAGPVYIPSLREGDDPYRMLQSLSAANVPAFKRDLPTDTFDKPVQNTEIKDFAQMVRQNDGYMYNFHGLAAKMADGKALSNGEYSALRLSLNILRPENQLSLDPNRLTEADKVQTRELVTQYYATNAQDLVVTTQSAAQGESEEQTYADIIAAMEKQDSAPKVDIKAVATAERARIDQERQETMRRIEEETMANLYRGPKI